MRISLATKQISLFVKLCNVIFRFLKSMLFEFFFEVPVVNTNHYVWFAIIKDFIPSRLEFIIGIVISNIKIFTWFKLNIFLNIKTS